MSENFIKEDFKMSVLNNIIKKRKETVADTQSFINLFL